MKSVAAALGAPVLRSTDKAALLARVSELRKSLGDRAILRAMHFFAENERVEAQKAALLSNDVDAFFEGAIASGRSSFCYLQNVYTTKNVSEQGISLALCLAEDIISRANAGGAWRVHGGGFAGTIQAFVPDAALSEFKTTMENVFGEGSCYILKIRSRGATKII
jgi:galactokinase